MKIFNDSSKIFTDKNDGMGTGVPIKEADWNTMVNKPQSYPPNIHSHHSTDIIDPLESLVFVEDFDSGTNKFTNETLEVLMTKNKPLVSQDSENEKVRVLSNRITVIDMNTEVNNTELLNIIGGKYIKNTTPKIKITKTSSGISIDAEIGTSDVNGLERVFNGTTPITDLKLNGTTYTLKDFMALAQRNNPRNIYVAEGGTNGTGDYMTPYSNLNLAFQALTDTRNRIMVQDFGDFSFITPNAQKLAFFSADNATVNGNITLFKPNSVYKVHNHIGDISITGSNITVIVTGTLTGHIITHPNMTPYVRINNFKNGGNQQPFASLGLSAGSVIGKYTIGLMAL
ncbi:MAG: hypothetical protein RR255_00300 [Bacilli bacterium]